MVLTLRKGIELKIYIAFFIERAILIFFCFKLIKVYFKGNNTFVTELLIYNKEAWIISY
jgi:hypothetical protein